MITSRRNRRWAVFGITCVVVFELSISIDAQSQSAPSGVSPVIQAPSVVQFGSQGPVQIVSGNGHPFAASYNAAGRLISLNSTTGRNAKDLRIYYRPDGRIARILFGNQYDVQFRYDPLGRQEIVDRLGNTLIRSNGGSGLYVAETIMDPQGILTSTLQQLQTLFSLFPSMPNLSATSTSGAAVAP